jgi:hypothetical protein
VEANKKIFLAMGGRVLDHVGFDVKDLAVFVKRLQAEDMTLDEPVRQRK